MTTPTGRYRDRPTRALGVSEHAGWRMKRYEITLDGASIAADVRDAAADVVTRHLAALDTPPALGFVILHHGEDAVWLLIDTWREELLYQEMHAAPLTEPTAFAPVPDDGPAGCVWELLVHAHERDAYVRHVMDPADGPHPDEYLADTVERRIP